MHMSFSHVFCLYSCWFWFLLVLHCFFEWLYSMLRCKWELCWVNHPSKRWCRCLLWGIVIQMPTLSTVGSKVVAYHQILSHPLQPLMVSHYLTINGCNGWLRTRVRFQKGSLKKDYHIASSHMLVSKIKSCMAKYKRLYCETVNGLLNLLLFKSVICYCLSWEPGWVKHYIVGLLTYKYNKVFSFSVFFSCN